MEAISIIEINDGQLAEKTVNFIIETEKKMKAFKEQYDEFKANLLEAMEQNGILKFEAENLKISYIGETERETFDSKQFKADMPDLYDEYVKFSKVKPSVRIKVD